jgi:hypothetical protein
MQMVDLTSIAESLRIGLVLAGDFWWIWLPIGFGFAAYHAWFDYKRAAYLMGMKWVMLEIIPPPDVPFSSPKAAESIFAGLHASYSGGTSWKPQFFTGKIPDWFSFEIVSNGGESHFYIRCPAGQRDVVESLVFSQYPDAEIRIAEDYTALVPAKPDLKEYDIAGFELEFTKDSAYPIKTYMEFEEAGGKDEYQRLDPMSPLLEMLSALRSGEYLWLQYVFRPTGGDWIKENQKTVDKLKGKKEEKPKPPFEGLFSSIDAALGIAKAEKKEEKKEEFNLQKLTASERKVLEAVEFKLSKLAFKTGIRVCYVARKEAFNGSRMASVTAMFKQLYYNNMNSFKPGKGTKDKGKYPWMFPSDKGFFADERTVGKKYGMLDAYRKRVFTDKICILNTEEFATLWHLPGLNVKAPLLPRVQSKKGQPPSILPTR